MHLSMQACTLTPHNAINEKKWRYTCGSTQRFVVTNLRQYLSSAAKCMKVPSRTSRQNGLYVESVEMFIVREKLEM